MAETENEFMLKFSATISKMGPAFVIHIPKRYWREIKNFKDSEDEGEKTAFKVIIEKIKL